MAQSFHWMDRERVAGLLRQMLNEDGALAFVHATTHQGVEGTAPLPHPRPPRQQIDALVKEFLGEKRRAGSDHRQVQTGSEDERGRIETQIFRAAGFTGPKRLDVPGWIADRSEDEVVASVFSLSYAAPHLFGEHIGVFEHQLRTLLEQSSLPEIAAKTCARSRYTFGMPECHGPAEPQLIGHPPTRSPE